MKEQIGVVAKRDGTLAAIAYAEQTLKVYRACARPQRDGKKHFAHAMPFRPHFVRAIIYLRKAVSQYYKTMQDQLQEQVNARH